MPTLGTDNTDTVKRALEVYSKRSQQIAPYVQAAVVGEIQVPRQSMPSEVWLTFALFWEGSHETLENLVRDADIVGHSLPSAEEVAWTLLMLKDRGWLSIRGELYALTAEGRSIDQSIVGNGNLRERTQRLEEWISTHPLKGNQRESW